ncbi:hypothetical protein RF11_05408 [Thelohanellus kitauei]|uniref:Uncharacterized protein n=1 Tax=Thelohanellus kitauei TaxID=669202 RepID=A0A0C2JAS7_THEKT|nr:hypothetical protein RF11_05408 [Thelohanellus kitauei]
MKKRLIKNNTFEQSYSIVDKPDNDNNHSYSYPRVVKINKCFNYNSNSAPIFVELLSNRYRVDMNVDSDAEVSYIGKSLWKMIGSPTLQMCQKLKGYMGSIIPTLGKTYIDVEYQVI